MAKKRKKKPEARVWFTWDRHGDPFIVFVGVGNTGDFVVPRAGETDEALAERAKALGRALGGVGSVLMPHDWLDVVASAETRAWFLAEAERCALAPT